MANINNYFLSNLSASVGISYDLKTNVLGSTNSPNSAIFNLSQIATLLTTGKPKFGIFDAENIFSLSFNNDYFSFTAGKVFYETQLINIQSQTFSCTSDLDYAGTKCFKFYFDYLDFVNFSNIFYANVVSVSKNIVVVDQLPSSSYLNNISQINLNGYIFNVLAIDTATNSLIISSDVETNNIATAGDSLSFVLQPKIKFTSLIINNGTPPDFPIPSTAIIIGSCSVTISGTTNLTYAYNSDYQKLYIAYPSYSDPASLFPNSQSYNSFLNTVNNSFKTYKSVQNFDYESSIYYSFLTTPKQ